MSFPDPSIFYERAERWAVSAFHREELPARAFYVADPETRDLLEYALFEAVGVSKICNSQTSARSDADC
jgi:hypothetical protein